MADRLSAGMTREAARALLLEHNKDPFHIEHGETVEQVMRYFAREFDPDNEEFWGIVLATRRVSGAPSLSWPLK